MASLWVNYVYRIFFSSAVASSALAIIKIFDSMGLEIHFIRFAYWTLVDSIEGKYWLDAVGLDIYLLALIVPA